MILYILILHRDIPKVEDIMPVTKGHTVRFHLNNVPRVLRFIDTEGRVVACRVWGRGQELVFKGRGVSVLQDVKNSGDWR